MHQTFIIYLLISNIINFFFSSFPLLKIRKFIWNLHCDLWTEILLLFKVIFLLYLFFFFDYDYEVLFVMCKVCFDYFNEDCVCLLTFNCLFGNNIDWMNEWNFLDAFLRLYNMIIYCYCFVLIWSDSWPLFFFFFNYLLKKSAFF